MIADSGLASMHPLMTRAIGEIRLLAPDSQIEEARDLIRRAEAGEFAVPLLAGEEIESQVTLPWPLAAAGALLDPAAGLAATRRSRGGWLTIIGSALVVGALILVLALVVVSLGRGLLPFSLNR